jgi:hypothetical protein
VREASLSRQHRSSARQRARLLLLKARVPALYVAFGLLEEGRADEDEALGALRG